MEIGAVAEVLEHVPGFGERRLPAPGHAFAAHLGEGVGAAVHPGDHVVAADAAERAAALGHLRGGVVRAARAVVRGAREVRARQGQFLLLRLDPGHARLDRLAGEEARQAPRDHQRDHRRRQLVGARQDPVALLVVLADHRGTYVVVPVEHVLLHLRLDEGALLLDDDDVFQAAREVADADRLQRPGHADLVHADADLARVALADAQVLERLQHVEVALAGGDDAQARVRRVEHGLVDAVGARERARGLHGVLVQAHFLVQRRIRPADVEAAGRQREVFRQHDVELVRIDVDAGRRLDRLGDRLEADPAAGEARHRPAEQAHVEDVLHAGRIEHRHHRADEFQFRAVRQGRGAAGVVVGGEREHAAELRGAGRVAVPEHVAAAVHARTLAVPHREHAVVLGAGEQVGLLRAPHHRRAEVLVEAGRELDVRGLQVLLRLPQLEVEAAQRRAAVAGDEAGGVRAGRAVAHLLHQRQAHQRLHAGQVDAAFSARVLVLERVLAIDRRRESGGGNGHGGYR